MSDSEDAPRDQIHVSIGELIGAARNLSAHQIEQITAYQQQHHTRFGEAAIALGFATNEDVVSALSQQFDYPYIYDVESINPELIVATDPFSEKAEAFRELRSQLMMGVLNNDSGEPKRALAALSPEIGDGKTYVSANTAISFCQLGGRTLLIDADMRTPRLHSLFGLGNVQSGLSSLLSGRGEDRAIYQISQLPNLFVMPAGAIPPNPLELLQRPTFALLMRELLDKFDYVIVDTPAAVHGADSRVVAARCGAALIVARQNHSRLDSVGKLLSSIKLNARSAGVIYNKY